MINNINYNNNMNKVSSFFLHCLSPIHNVFLFYRVYSMYHHHLLPESDKRWHNVLQQHTIYRPFFFYHCSEILFIYLCTQFFIYFIFSVSMNNITELRKKNAKSESSFHVFPSTNNNRNAICYDVGKSNNNNDKKMKASAQNN